MDINKLLYPNQRTVIVNFATLNHEIIGRLIIENNRLKFEGNSELSANIFFNEALKPVVDNYLREQKILQN